MLRLGGFRLVLRLTFAGVVLAFAPAAPLRAQGPGSPGLRFGPAPPQESVQAGGSTRSPAVAGILSLFLPGAGSFYAGHPGHGVRHLLIGAASSGIALIGLIVVVVNQDGGNPGKGGALFVAGSIAYVANDVWSVVTAVNDASRHNAASGQPGVSGFGGMLRPEPRLGIPLVRIMF